MKPFVRNLGGINERQDLTQIKTNGKADKFLQNFIKYTIQNSQIPEEKSAKCLNQNRQVLDENQPKLSITGIRYQKKLKKKYC